MGTNILQTNMSLCSRRKWHLIIHYCTLRTHKWFYKQQGRQQSCLHKMLPSCVTAPLPCGYILSLPCSTLQSMHLCQWALQQPLLDHGVLRYVEQFRHPAAFGPIPVLETIWPLFWNIVHHLAQPTWQYDTIFMNGWCALLHNIHSLLLPKSFTELTLWAKLDQKWAEKWWRQWKLCCLCVEFPQQTRAKSFERPQNLPNPQILVKRKHWCACDVLASGLCVNGLTIEVWVC